MLLLCDLIPNIKSCNIERIGEERVIVTKSKVEPIICHTNDTKDWFSAAKQIISYNRYSKYQHSYNVLYYYF